MKTTKSKFKEILKQEITATLSEVQVSQQDFKKMSARDALRVSGGDDRSLRKAIADFVVKGGEDRQEVLAQAIGDYQYSDPYLVTLAQQLLAKQLANSTTQKRIQVAKSVEKQMNEHIQSSRLKNIIKEEISKIMNEMAIDEMAFSLKDLESATADVNQRDMDAQAQKNGKRLQGLFNDLRNAYNSAGGTGVVDPQAMKKVHQNVRPVYHKNLAIIHQVLGNLARKMLKGDNMVALTLSDWERTHHARQSFDADNDAVANDLNEKLEDSLIHLFRSIQAIVDFAKETSDIPAPEFNEPYLSSENAQQLAKLAHEAEVDLLKPKGGVDLEPAPTVQ